MVRRRKKRKIGWRGRLSIAFALIASVVFLPTTIVLVIGMLPTVVAIIINRGKNMSKAIAVGAMNVAGCMPFLMELWTKEHTFTNAISIVSDPMAIVVMYAASAVGYMIEWSLTGVVSNMLYQRGTSRLKIIEKRKQELVQNWGQEVTGEIALDHEGFPLPAKGNVSDEKD